MYLLVKGTGFNIKLNGFPSWVWSQSQQTAVACRLHGAQHLFVQSQVKDGFYVFSWLKEIE